ncbi:MAG TPA: hypothetical protein VHX11_10950 [Acidobacteriaceae bacterium]|nr:hypothetical protein [Acidobacteriaceae bacterium]
MERKIDWPGVRSSGPSVVSLKYIEQFGELDWFEEQLSGAEAHLFGDFYGTTELVA